ncbi:MAG: EamA family transporter, partial [Anaerolineales bacterium]|nr:EamA family transporter [Anaerolineales bacterium]
PTRRWLLATLLSLTGCGLLLLSGGDLRPDPGGLLLALAAGGCYAVYVVASKGLAERPSLPTQAAIFTAGSLLLLPLLFAVDLTWLAAPRARLMVLHLGVVTIGVAYVLFANGLRRLPAATAATLSLAEPLTAGLLGTRLLGERLPPIALAGLALLFAGLALLTTERNAEHAKKTQRTQRKSS